MLCEKNQIQMVNEEAKSHGYEFPTAQTFFTGVVNHFGFFYSSFWFKGFEFLPQSLIFQFL